MIDHVLVREAHSDVPSLHLPPQLAPRTRPPALPSLLLQTPVRGGGGGAVPGGARPPGPLLQGDQRRPFPADIEAVHQPSPVTGRARGTRGTGALLLSRYDWIGKLLPRVHIFCSKNTHCILFAKSPYIQ